MMSRNHWRSVIHVLTILHKICSLLLSFHINYHHSFEIFPYRRNFIPLPGSYGLTPSGLKDPVILRIQQFNVLADGLASLRDDLGKFSRTSKEILDFDTRKHQLLHEVTQYSADIITLQECDHYYDFFFPELEKRGYDGYFAPKPTSACLEVSENSDGCALFVRREKLSVLSIETKTLALSRAELGEGGEVQEDGKSIKAQNQVAIIAVCLLKNASDHHIGDHDDSAIPSIIVATTHLKSSKTIMGERHRALGMRQILDQVDRIYQSLEDRGKTPAVLLTGVLNAVSEPSIEGYQPLTYELVKDHILGLRSVYNDDIPSNHTRLNASSFYTTWKSRMERDGERITKRAVDYIFYSTYRNGTHNKGVEDRTQLNAQPSSVATRKQIATSFVMRCVVYFFALSMPTSWLSKALITLLMIELSSPGSIFQPQLPAIISSSPSSSSSSSMDVRQIGRPGFHAVRAVDVYDDDEIGPNLLPNDKYPSDHISIIADLHLLW